MKVSPNQPFTQRSTGLSRKKTTPEAGKARPVHAPEAPPAPAVSGVWETRIEPFLAKHARVLVVGFVLLGIGRIVSTYHVFATTATSRRTSPAGCNMWRSTSTITRRSIRR